MGHGQGAEVENLRGGNGIQRQLLFLQHHVRPGFAVEGKVPVAVGKGLHKGQGGGNLPVHHQGLGADARVPDHIP